MLNLPTPPHPPAPHSKQHNYILLRSNTEFFHCPWSLFTPRLPFIRPQDKIVNKTPVPHDLDKCVPLLGFGETGCRAGHWGCRGDCSCREHERDQFGGISVPAPSPSIPSRIRPQVPTLPLGTYKVGYRFVEGRNSGSFLPELGK